MVKTFTHGDGKYELTAQVVDTGNGLSITITGGDKPHVGGIALSTADGKVQKASLENHRDVEAASMMAEEISKNLQIPVSVTVGIHIDNATSEDIEQIISNCRILAVKIVDFSTKN